MRRNTRVDGPEAACHRVIRNGTTYGKNERPSADDPAEHHRQSQPESDAIIGVIATREPRDTQRAENERDKTPRQCDPLLGP